jgi:diguanylate cyclase
MGWLLRCCALLMCLSSSWVAAAVELDENHSSRTVAPALSYLRDDSHQLQLADVLARPEAWRPNGAHVFNQGYSSASWWLRFDVHNPLAQASRQLLEIAYPVLDEVEVWELAGGQVLNHYLLGDKQPFHDRPIDNRNFLLPLNLQASADVTMVLRLRTSSSVQAPLTLWQYQAYFDND